MQELAEARSALERRTSQLETLQEQLREQADRDWLTGLHNRRYLAREVGRHAAAPGPGPFSLAVLDLDHFKVVNDRFGHPAGDEVLMRVAALLLGEMRGQDVVVRTGGEEFVLLMPQTDANAAATACERLRAAIRVEPWDRIAPGIDAHGQHRRGHGRDGRRPARADGDRRPASLRGQARRARPRRRLSSTAAEIRGRLGAHEVAPLGRRQFATGRRARAADQRGVREVPLHEH